MELLLGFLEHVDKYALRSTMDALFERMIPLFDQMAFIVVEILDKEGNALVVGAGGAPETKGGKRHVEEDEPIKKGEGLIWTMINTELSGSGPQWLRKIHDYYIVTDMKKARTEGDFIPVIKKTKSVLLVPIYFGTTKRHLVGAMAIDSKIKDAFSVSDRKFNDFLSTVGKFSGFLLEAYYREYHDPRLSLDTRVFHRGYLTEFLSNRLLHRGNIGELYISLFDINGFRSINEKYGHITGNEIIEYFSKGIQSKCEDYQKVNHNRIAVPFRYGGDEFTIVMDAGSEQEVGDFITGIDDYLQDTKDVVKKIVKGDDVSISFSVGIANDQGLELSRYLKKVSRYVDSFIDESDELMYKAKNFFREGSLDCSVLCFKDKKPVPIGNV